MSVRCPRCGTIYGDGARFCTRDGSRLLADGSAAGSESPAEAGGAAGARAGKTAPAAGGGVGQKKPGGAPASAGRGKGAAGAAGGARGLGGGGDAAQLPAHATLTGQTIDNRFLIERKVGEGGMSFVYLAVDMSTGDQRAIKVLSPSLSRDANAMARLRREAELAGRLKHPHVCHIEHLGQTSSGLVYVVMPYVQGEILADRTYRLGHLPLAEVVGYVAEIAAGLQAAHDLQIVHRDLKPENIMITPGPSGRTHAVVMDFGLAKERRAGAELEKLTATGIVLGTPEFMSPEQLRGKPLDGRTDVYSLALMTVEMLTGALPFAGRSQQELMIARLRNDPTPLRKLRPDLDFPGSVERVLLKALERSPEDRFATAPEFAAALSAATRPGAIGTTTAALKKWFG